MVENLSGRIFFQEKVKFLKSGIWFQFYASSNKDTFLDSDFFRTWAFKSYRHLKNLCQEFLKNLCQEFLLCQKFLKNLCQEFLLCQKFLKNLCQEFLEAFF